MAAMQALGCGAFIFVLRLSQPLVIILEKFNKISRDFAYVLPPAAHAASKARQARAHVGLA